MWACNKEPLIFCFDFQTIRTYPVTGFARIVQGEQNTWYIYSFFFFWQKDVAYTQVFTVLVQMFH